MTEDQASEKWCPQAMQYSGSGAYNRDGYAIPSSAFCMGSQCMAWRWVQDPLVSFVANGQPLTTKSNEGYCGLAGPL